MAQSYRRAGASPRANQQKKAQQRVLAFLVLFLMVVLLSGVITWVIQLFQGDQPQAEMPELVTPGIVGSVLAPLPGEHPVVDETVHQFENIGPVQQTGDTVQLQTLDADRIALPENGLVDSTKYLPDVVFLGDSVTEGLDLYESPALGVATVCGYRGAVPSDIVNRKTMNRYRSETVVATEVALDVLAEKKPKAVYLMFGANALANHADDSVEKGYFGYYQQMILAIRELLGDEVDIYIQSMTPVVQGYANTNLNNDRIKRINEQLAQLATQNGCYYLDVYSALEDETGALNPDYSTEGLHLNAAGYQAWMDYLLRHVAYDSSLPFVMGSTYYRAS